MRSRNEFEQVFRPFLFLALAFLMTPPVAFAADPLSEEQMMADVRRYESFGLHRYGSPGSTAALDWIAAELGKAGLKVNSQPFAMERQYEFTSGNLKVGDRKLDVMPQWWMPEKQANFSLTASIAPLPAKPGDPIVKAAGRFVRVDLPYDRGAYLNDDHRAKLFHSRPHVRIGDRLLHSGVQAGNDGRGRLRRREHAVKLHRFVFGQSRGGHGGQARRERRGLRAQLGHAWMRLAARGGRHVDLAP